MADPSNTRRKQKRSARMPRAIQQADDPNPEQGRIEFLRVEIALADRRRVKSWASLRGLSIPRAYGRLILAGLAATEQGEVNYGSGQSTASVG